jgi:hypothetical protein
MILISSFCSDGLSSADESSNFSRDDGLEQRQEKSIRNLRSSCAVLLYSRVFIQ